VAGNRRRGDGKTTSNLAGGKRPGFEFLQDLAAGRIRESAKNLGSSFHHSQFSYFANNKQAGSSSCYARYVLPTLEGVIRRRILLNFRADPNAVAPLLRPCWKFLPIAGLPLWESV
jgi:hypothetical protein